MFNDSRLPERFWTKLEIVSTDYGECWLWRGCLDPYGYGSFRWQGRVRGAHRVAYIELVGLENLRLQLDHLCRQRACANPAHLEPVIQKVNLDRCREFWAETADSIL